MKTLLCLGLLPLLGIAQITAGPVTDHGALRVSGHQIVGSDGKPVSLAGVSFGWSQWEAAPYYNARVVNWLKDDWHAGIVRAAMGVEPDAYLAHPKTEKDRVGKVVDAALAADIYVLIDWHDHHAHKHTVQSVAFFQEMARKYGRHPNIIYEIYNEPLNDVSWTADIKPYAEKVIAAIRAIDPSNLIVVGTPSWSQDVDVAAADPIKGDNIAYTLHFYAGTHKQDLRDKAVKAMNRGIALFVTEWGTCNADGAGPVDVASVNEWMKFMRDWQLSHCNWGVYDKPETASIIVPGASHKGGWKEKDLTKSGRFVREIVRSWSNPPAAAAP